MSRWKLFKIILVDETCVKNYYFLLRFIIQSTIRKRKTWSPGTNSRLAFAVTMILNLSNVEPVQVFRHDRTGWRVTNRPRKPRQRGGLLHSVSRTGGLAHRQRWNSKHSLSISFLYSLILEDCDPSSLLKSVLFNFIYNNVVTQERNYNSL